MPGFLTGLVGNMGGVALQGVGLAANAAASAAKFIIGLITSAISIAARGILAFGSLLAGIAVGGVVAFVAAIKSATASAIQFSRSVIDLRNSTGMSTGQAQRVANRFGAFGIGPSELSNNGQYHGITEMTARMYGVNPNDPASINARAQGFGGGLMGHIMRRSMLSNLGMDTDNGRFLAGLRPEKVQQQLGYQNRIQGALGITPETMRKFAEDLPLVTARIGMVVDAIKMKFTATLFPIVERTLGRVADYLAKHSDAIGKAIEQAGKWLTEDLPPMILQGAISFLSGAGYFLKGLGEFTLSLITQVPHILDVLDTILNGLRAFAAIAAGVANAIGQAVKRLATGQPIPGKGTAPAAPGSPGTPGTPTTAGAAPAVPGDPGGLPPGWTQAMWDAYIQSGNPYTPGEHGTTQSGVADTLLRVAIRLGRYGSVVEKAAYAVDRAAPAAAKAAEAVAKAGKVAKGAAGVATIGAAAYGAYQVYGMVGAAGPDFTSAQKNVLGMVGKSNMAGNPDLISNIQDILQRTGDASNSGGDRLLAMAETLKAQLAEQKKGNSLAAEAAKETKRVADNMNGFGARVVGVAAAAVTEDLGLAFTGGS